MWAHANGAHWNEATCSNAAAGGSIEVLRALRPPRRPPRRAQLPPSTAATSSAMGVAGPPGAGAGPPGAPAPWLALEKLFREHPEIAQEFAAASSTFTSLDARFRAQTDIVAAAPHCLTAASNARLVLDLAELSDALVEVENAVRGALELNYPEYRGPESAIG